MKPKVLNIATILAFLLIQPAFVSKASAVARVVGNGTAASCTEAALNKALQDPGAITFNCGPNPITIRINSEKVLIGDYAIDGGGKITLDGQGKTRIFSAQGINENNISLISLENLTLQNGFTNNASSNHGRGAALDAQIFTHTYINNVKFLNNRAMADNTRCVGGGAIWFGEYTRNQIFNSVFRGNIARNGGAINDLFGDLVIRDSVFENNQALHTANLNSLGTCGGGGALYLDGGGQRDGHTMEVFISGSVFRNNKTNDGGGAIISFFDPYDTFEIDHSIFDSNSSVFFAPADRANMEGGTSGAINFNSFTENGKYTTLRISNSTISNNHADYYGGGIVAYKPVALTNVTLSGNSATNTRKFTGNEVYKNGYAGAIWTADRSSFTNVTITNNTAWNTSGGIAVISEGTNKVTIANTIIANNKVINSSQVMKNCDEKLVDLGGNIQYPAKGTNTRDTNCSDTIKIADPLLAGIADNGGLTKTHALMPGSPAINTGKPGYCPAFDQRGYIRVGSCDSGAFEYNGEPFKPSDWIYLPAILRP